jgi:hypothetical protein
MVRRNYRKPFSGLSQKEKEVYDKLKLGANYDILKMRRREDSR